LFCGENRRDEEEGKKSSNKSERGDKAPTRNALAHSLSLCVVVVFKADLSLSSTSLLLFRVGENNRALTHVIKRKRKSSNTKAEECEKAGTPKLRSESALFSLFCCFLFCAFSTKPYEIIPSEVVEISSVSQQRSAFPHY
jgi:hypothetical protein